MKYKMQLKMDKTIQITQSAILNPFSSNSMANVKKIPMPIQAMNRINFIHFPTVLKKSMSPPHLDTKKIAGA